MMKTKSVNVLIIIVMAAFLSACANNTEPEDTWPTDVPETPILEVVETPEEQILPEVQEVPDFDTWVIGDTVTDEQKIYINRLVEFFYYNYYSPSIRPDCEIVQEVFASENPWNGEVEQHCEAWAGQNKYVMYQTLPDLKIAYYAFPDSPNYVKFVVRVDTVTPWVPRVRYFDDGGTRGYIQWMNTILDFHIAIEDGKLLVHAVDQFQLDDEDNVYIFNDIGDLVKVKK